MLLTLTTTYRPATDLGYLLAKHPGRLHAFSVPWGKAHVFWPEAGEERATAALLVEMDTIGLVRAGAPDDDAPLAQYVNDRPYAASSFLSVALSRVYSTALAGRSRERQELADTPLPLEARLYAVPCRGGESVLRRLFEPLGYAVDAAEVPADHAGFGESPVGLFETGDPRSSLLHVAGRSVPDLPRSEHSGLLPARVGEFPRTFPALREPGRRPMLDVALRGTVRLAELLGHLYVLVPVLDDAKHYWVGQDEVDKLLERGEAWLADHPERELVVRRYLKHRGPLIRSALERLVSDEPEESGDAERADGEAAIERPLGLDQQRLARVHAVLRACGARAVADLGCGEGKLLSRLLRDDQFERVIGVDASTRALTHARRRLDPERLPEKVVRRLQLLQGSITYRDDRLKGLDAVALVEVIEHVEPERLPAVEHAIFGWARPGVVVLTTPNAEYNARFELSGFRHRDHRFEWTREQLADWCGGVAARRGYTVELSAVGEVDPVLGPPTQLAVFTREAR